MQCSGSRILIEALIEQGVDTIFGYPGGAVLFIYDELFRQKDRIRHVLTSHEQHAAHAADGYARSTGKVGVCLATSGPGATNLITDIASAYMDSIPMVAITGNVATDLLGKDSFQEVDITGISMPVVKHNWIVKDVNELAEIVREAFLVAKSGRPGPVLIDIPKDITNATGTWTPEQKMVLNSAEKERAARLAQSLTQAEHKSEDIARVVELIDGSERPVFYAGGGVILSETSELLQKLAEKMDAPVATSLMAMGCLPASHPLATGMIGMHGSRASNLAIQKADLIIAVGARFSDRVVSRADKFARSAKVIHIDIDGAEINKNINTEASIVGQLEAILTELIGKIKAKSNPKWREEIKEWKKLIPSAHSAKRPLHPRFVIEESAKALGEDALVVTDVGQHQIWTAQFYPFVKPRTFLSSGGLGTMGYGLGAAVGAKIANPTRPVVLFTGDGSFRMNCAEMATLTNYGAPVLIVLLNNRALGMVYQWQTLVYDERHAETPLDRPPDFMKLAEAYGFQGYRAHDEVSFISALSASLKSIAQGKGALLEAIIDSREQVLPMVAGGKAIDEQIMGDQ